MKKFFTILIGVFALQFSNHCIADIADYVLGGGDVVHVSVYDHPDMTAEIQISNKGVMNFPLIGNVNTKGLTANQLEKVVAQRLVQGNYLKEAHVNIIATQYKSLKVSVLGEVNRPGKLQLDGVTTLVEALSMAGGISPNGGTKIILLRTDGDSKPTRQIFDISKLMNGNGDSLQSSINLTPNDTIYVPRAEQFYVYGEVLRPGVYHLDRRLTVEQALAVSGGKSPKASSGNPVLKRQGEDGSITEHSASLRDVVQDGDVIFIKEALF